MHDFEETHSSWDQAEQSRHAALLRQLKAELQEQQRRTLPTRSVSSMPVPKEQPAQPDVGVNQRVQFEVR